MGVTLVNSYVAQWERRRALALLATAMRDTGKVALAQEVSHGKACGCPTVQPAVQSRPPR